MNDHTFQENVVVLTGASSGIGREMAYQLARQGAWLSLAARDVQRLEQVANTCREAGARALVIETDVAEESQCQRLIARTIENYGRIDTLINNAGITMWALFEEMQTLAPFERIIQVNYFGSLFCTYYALPYRKRERATVCYRQPGGQNRRAYSQRICRQQARSGGPIRFVAHRTGLIRRQRHACIPGLRRH